MRTLTILTLLFIAHQQELPRSIYVSVRFEACEHIEHATIELLDKETYKVVQSLGTLPREQKFMFTYFPELKNKLAPSYQVKVKGIYKGEPLEKIMSIGPQKILIHHLYEGRKPTEILLNKTGYMDRILKMRIDARYNTKKIIITCSPTCNALNKQENTESKQNPQQ
jgi:hypothetical protein